MVDVDNAAGRWMFSKNKYILCQMKNERSDEGAMPPSLIRTAIKGDEDRQLLINMECDLNIKV